jgi:hypothetical protein
MLVREKEKERENKREENRESELEQDAYVLSDMYACGSLLTFHFLQFPPGLGNISVPFRGFMVRVSRTG